MTAPLSLRLTAVVVGLVTAVACDSSKSPSMPDPAQPSANTAAPTSSGATISGLVSNGGSASGALMLMAAGGGVSGVTITVAGTTRTATTDGAGRFSLTNVPAGQVTLQFTGAATGSMSVDDVGEHDTIQINVHVHNGEVEDEQAQNGAEAQLEGKIVSVGGSSFVIGQVTIMVPSTATIRHGNQMLTFADLIAGARVHVKGSLAGSTLTATRVEVQQSGGPGPGNGNGGNGNGGNGNGGNGNGNGNGGNGNAGSGNGGNGGGGNAGGTND